MSPPNMNTPSTTDKLYPILPTSKEQEANENKDDPSHHHKHIPDNGNHLGSKPDDDKNHSPENQKLLDQNNDDGAQGSENSEEEPSEVVVPPDGGWGWVIVLASFLCNMIVDGIIFSFGMFLKDIASTFHVSTTQVSLMGSLMSGFYLIAGPFASAIANRYGFRLVAIVGSFMGAAAFAISYFAKSLQFLYVSYGLLGGIGFGFIYVPSVITVGFYFERWRALATGIAVCGSGIGTFLFAPISKALISNLGWRWALQVQGAVVLTCAIYGSLFRPLKPTKVKDLKTGTPELKMDPSKLPHATKLQMERALTNTRATTIGSSQEHMGSVPHLLGVKHNSDYPRGSDVYHTIHVPNRMFDNQYSTEKRLSVPFIHSHDKSHKAANRPAIIVPRRLRTTSDSQNNPSDTAEVNRPLYREDIFFGASLTRLPQYTSKTSVAYNLSVTRLPTKTDIEEEKKHSCKICPEAVRRALATLLDFSLLKSPSFLILAFSGFLTMMGFYVPFMFLQDRASRTMDEQTAVFLVSAMGIANTVGRVLCGVLSSFPGVDALFVTNAALTIGGLATIFSGVSLSAEYQFFYTAVFGLAISCFASLRSIIVVDLLGLENLTNAFGLLLLFQGVAAAIGAPVAGAFRDATGSYDASFYLSGSLIFASAVMCYPLNWVNKWEKRRNDRKNSVTVLRQL